MRRHNCILVYISDASVSACDTQIERNLEMWGADGLGEGGGCSLVCGWRGWL